MASATYLFGKNPLKEALLFSARRNTQIIDQVYFTKTAEADPEMMSLVQSRKIPYNIVTVPELESMVGKYAVHQGVVATLVTKALYTSLDEALLLAKQKVNPMIIVLDELQDPHNVGAIIRSACAFGASAVLMPEHDQAQITGTVIKSSAGTVFSVPVVRIGNINTTLRQLKGQGFWIYGLTGNGDTELHQTKFDAPSVLVIGSEGSGIAKKTLEHCDFKLSIPMDPACESLNASNAVVVALYEWNKQTRT